MTTSQKLWLGFGTLTALLVLFSVAIIVRLRSVETHVKAQAEIARPRSAAARELEINVVGYALAVRTFIQTDDPKFRQEAAEDAADVEQHLAEYERLATTDRQQELAARFADLWKEFKAFGQTMLDSKDRPLKREDSERLAQLRMELEEFLDKKLQVEAAESYDARRDATFRDVRAVGAFALILLLVGVVVAVLTSGVVGRGVVKAERRLQENRERLRVTLASIGDAVITTDNEGRVTTLNPVAVTLTGWKQDEAAGRPLAEVFRIVNEDTRQPVEDPVKKVLTKGHVVGLGNHTVLLAKDGSEHPIDDSAAPIRDAEGKILGVVLVFRDVAEQRRAARRIAESEARKTAILDTALDCIITIDHEGKVVEFNPAAERTFGYRRADVLGREMGELIVPPAQREAHRKGMARYLATGEGPVLNRHLELTAVRSDGTEFPVELAITPIPGLGRPLFTGYLRDISERQKAVRVIADARAYAESIVDTVWEPLVVLDADLRVKTVNRSFCQTFHVTPEETQGRLIYDLGNCQWDIPALRKLLEEVLPQNTQFNDYEVEHHFPTIGKRVMLLNARRIYREGNHTELILLAIEDVTDRRGAEASGRRLAAIVESSEDAIASKDLNGVITSWNRAAERMFGYTAQEMVGQSVMVLIPADRADEEPEILRRIRKGEKVPHYETVRRRKDGKRIPVSLAVSPILDSNGRVVGASKSLRDITERKRAEEAVRQSERQFRTVIEQVKDYAIFTTDPEGRATSWNEGVKRILGFDEADFLGKDIVSTIFTPEDVQQGVAGHELKEAAAKGTASNDRWMRKKDGSRFFAMGVTTARRDEAGTLLGFTKVMRDQTERKRMEDELRRVAADLSETDRRKTEFLAMLAHELRNPLAPIRNSLQILRLTGGAGEAVASASEMMERQVGQMTRLIDDLLDVSRISRGKIELKKERIELAPVIHDAVEAARPPCESMSHALTVTLPPKPIYLNADPTRLTQIVGNLLNNACKFTERGGRIGLTVEVVRSQESGIRSQESGIRSQESGIRRQSDDRNQGASGVILLLTPLS